MQLFSGYRKQNSGAQINPGAELGVGASPLVAIEVRLSPTLYPRSLEGNLSYARVEIPPKRSV
jgi:hypothetical protein